MTMKFKGIGLWICLTALVYYLVVGYIGNLAQYMKDFLIMMFAFGLFMFLFELLVFLLTGGVDILVDKIEGWKCE